MLRKSTKPARKGFRYDDNYGWYWYEDEHSLDKCIEFWSRDHTPVAFTRPGPAPAAAPAPAPQQQPLAKRPSRPAKATRK